MTDDIVTQPEEQMDFVEYLRLWASPDSNDQAVRDLHKAADEIEHLHKLLNDAEIERELWRERCDRAEECLDWIYRTKRRWRLW